MNHIIGYHKACNDVAVDVIAGRMAGTLPGDVFLFYKPGKLKLAVAAEQPDGFEVATRNPVPTGSKGVVEMWVRYVTGQLGNLLPE